MCVFVCVCVVALSVPLKLKHTSFSLLTLTPCSLLFSSFLFFCQAPSILFFVCSFQDASWKPSLQLPCALAHGLSADVAAHASLNPCTHSPSSIHSCAHRASRVDNACIQPGVCVCVCVDGCVCGWVVSQSLSLSLSECVSTLLTNCKAYQSTTHSHILHPPFYPPAFSFRPPCFLDNSMHKRPQWHRHSQNNRACLRKWQPPQDPSPWYVTRPPPSFLKQVLLPLLALLVWFTCLCLSTIVLLSLHVRVILMCLFVTFLSLPPQHYFSRTLTAQGSAVGHTLGHAMTGAFSGNKDEASQSQQYEQPQQQQGYAQPAQQANQVCFKAFVFPLLLLF